MGLCAQKNQYFRTGMGPLRASDDFPNALLADDIKTQQLVLASAAHILKLEQYRED